MVLPRLRPGTVASPIAVSLGLRAVLPLLLAVLASAWTIPALAQGEDAFTVRDVDVDVTADSAAAARDQAILVGQRKAFNQLLLNLAPPDDVARLPPLGDDAIGDMVLDFTVDQENVSTVRYIGKLAFRFRAEPVRQYLEQGGANYAMRATRPALVLPVLTRDGASLLWDDGNDWLAAWSGRTLDGTLVSFVVPLGDLTDIATIDGPRALDGDKAAMQTLATRYGAGDVIVAEARPAVDPATGEASVVLDARRYTLAGIDGTLQDRLSAPGGEAALADLYGQSAQRVSAFLEEQWKRENLVTSTVEQRLAVVAPLDSLEAWIDLHRRLGDVSTIRHADLLELSRGQARLDLVYLGDQAQLVRALAQRDLALVPVAPVAAAGPGAPPGQPPAPAPGTQGAVTVDPGAVPPSAAAPMPGAAQWELRRASRGTPASAPAAAPAPAPAQIPPAPAAPDQPQPTVE